MPIVSEVFLLGHWKDYDELESSLSMPEIMATLNAIHDAEKRRNKFMAALQGIDIDEAVGEEQKANSRTPTADEVKARAIARITGDKNLAGAVAEGITPEMGIDYMIAEGTEFG